MSRDEQIKEMAEMLAIIEEAREVYANDVTDHTENEYIREGLLNANFRKASDVAREIFEEIDALCEEYKYFCEGTYAPELKDAISELKKKYESEGGE